MHPPHSQSQEDVVAALTPEQLSSTDGNGNSLLSSLLFYEQTSASLALINKMSGEQIVRENNIGINAINIAMYSGNQIALKAIAPKVGRSVMARYKTLLNHKPTLKAACDEVAYNGADCRASQHHDGSLDRLLVDALMTGSITQGTTLQNNPDLTQAQNL